MKTTKAVVSGLVLGLAVVFAWWLLRVVWFLAAILWPVVLIAIVFYAIGNLLPSDVRVATENKIRDTLDSLDFKTGPAWWPWITRARSVLDWLGLHVPKGA